MFYTLTTTCKTKSKKVDAVAAEAMAQTDSDATIRSEGQPELLNNLHFEFLNYLMCFLKKNKTIILKTKLKK